MRAGDGVGVAHDKRRHAGDAALAGERAFPRDFGRSFVALEEITRGLLVDPAAGGDRAQVLEPANVLAVAEVGAEERLDDGILRVCLAREPDEAVGEKVFGVRSIRAKLNSIPSLRPTLAT